ncbi:probable desiccation-related protein LEA14 [Raphanus sativus]|uniref:Probable desiccation-related protein LEA14 n=1 Tax=Raphanus sativus TaxID=3726 RepID=A0A6J0LP60_RAPSA|nr:probable desiccation-related protein LEA14 [Raphanus sativus]
MASLLDKAKDFVADKLAGVPKPEGSVTDVDLKDVNRDSVEYLAKVSVTNPYSHAIPICEINFTIHSAGRFKRVLSLRKGGGLELELRSGDLGDS